MNELSTSPVSPSILRSVARWHDEMAEKASLERRQEDAKYHRLRRDEIWHKAEVLELEAKSAA